MDDTLQRLKRAHRQAGNSPIPTLTAEQISSLEGLAYEIIRVGNIYSPNPQGADYYCHFCWAQGQHGITHRPNCELDKYHGLIMDIIRKSEGDDDDVANDAGK